MRYLLCFIFPPLAVLLCKRPLSAFVNLLLCVLLVLPGVIHALIVVASTNKERRHAEMLSAVSGSYVAPQTPGEMALLRLCLIPILILVCAGVILAILLQIGPR